VYLGGNNLQEEEEEEERMARKTKVSLIAGFSAFPARHPPAMTVWLYPSGL